MLNKVSQCFRRQCDAVCQWLTKDFYKANTALATKTPTDFDNSIECIYPFTGYIICNFLLYFNYVLIIVGFLFSYSIYFVT